ncbi:substance-K receptor-like isoform X2 [Varroa destructor]|uniref:G-protein coupled receptors family 1 profile domain-containing protein n=1 Tax=Varroa destructor TaxID=109461 RepID=A0A7M7IXA9_VARDE|nr:substance-K receptor-like isoform X2 [Varroa destructor]
MEVQPTEVQMGHISSSGAAAVGQQLNWSECREQEQEIYIQYNMSYYGIADSEMAQERMGLWCVAIYVVTVVASLVGNWGVVLTVLLNRSMRTTVNFYLSNLAFADALIAMFCMWTYLVKHFHDSYVLGVFMCRVEGFVQMTAVTSSVLTLSAIACDRFVATLFPFHVRTTERRTNVVLGLIWLLSAATASPLLIYTTPIVVQWTDVELTYCGESWPQQIHWNPEQLRCVVSQPHKTIYYIAVTVTLFFLPVLIMAISYSMIVYFLWRGRPDITLNSNGNSTAATIHYRARKRVVKMACVVLGAFIICWCPFQVMVLFTRLQEDKPLPDWFSTVSFWCTYLAYANSAINPLIYGGMSHNFRAAFIRILRCGRGDHNRKQQVQGGAMGVVEGGTALRMNRAHVLVDVASSKPNNVLERTLTAIGAPGHVVQGQTGPHLGTTHPGLEPVCKSSHHRLAQNQTASISDKYRIACWSRHTVTTHTAIHSASTSCHYARASHVTHTHTTMARNGATAILYQGTTV